MRLDDSTEVPMIFLWNPNAIKGYAVSLIIFLICWFVFTNVNPPDVEPIRVRESTPVELLYFGAGTGPGGSKGNLAEEGASQRGPESKNPLEDASTMASSSQGKNAPMDPTSSSNLRPTSEVGSKGKDNQSNAEKTIGSSDGDDNGKGLGMTGAGVGKGFGNDDINWGGGGNRTVVRKQLPTMPPGVFNTSVKLKFRVDEDGTVTDVWLVKKGGNPEIDERAKAALKRWKFNKYSGGEMEGTITFKFVNL